MSCRRALVALMLLCVGSAGAQQRLLPASKPVAAPCVQVRIGNDEAGRWSCLNQALKAEVDKVAPVIADEAPGERIAPIGLGLATPAATRQRLGDQYGRSVVPQRPARQFAPPALKPVR